MKILLRRPGLAKLKRERIFILFLRLCLFLIAFISITLGNMLWISISAAICSTLIAFFFGVPLAYFLARKDFIGKSIIECIVDVPLVVPHIVAGIALYGVFMRYGVIGAPFEKLGIAVIDAFPGISEFAAVMIIASFPRSASILIGDRFTAYGLSGLPGIPGARPISVLLISICLVIFVLLRIIVKRKRV